MEHDKYEEGSLLQRYIIDDGQTSDLDSHGAPATSTENGLRVLVRRIPKIQPLQLKDARREIEVLSSTSDAALPVLAEHLDAESYLWLVIYDRPSRSLREVIESDGPLPEDALKSAVTQLFSGVAVLFNAGYAHLRICDQTLFLDSDYQLTIKGTQYVHQYGTEKMDDLYAATEEKYGDDIYVAPEIFASRTYNARKATMWSCGVATYYMATGQTKHLSNLGHPSFEGTDSSIPEETPQEPPRRFSLSGRKLSISAQAKMVSYPGTNRFGVPNYARDIISKMLNTSPQKRAELIEVAAKVPKEFESKVSRPLIELAWLDYKAHVGPYAGLDTAAGMDSSASSIFSGVSNLSNPLAALLPGRRRSSVAGGTESSHRRKSSTNKIEYA